MAAATTSESCLGFYSRIKCNRIRESRERGIGGRAHLGVVIEGGEAARR